MWFVISSSLKTSTGQTSITVPADIGFEAKTPRPSARLNASSVGSRQLEEEDEVRMTWLGPLAVLGMRCGPWVLSRGVPSSNASGSCCIGLGTSLTIEAASVPDSSRDLSVLGYVRRCVRTKRLGEARTRQARCKVPTLRFEHSHSVLVMLEWVRWELDLSYDSANKSARHQSHVSH